MQFLIEELKEVKESLEVQADNYARLLIINIEARSKVMKFIAEEEGKEFDSQAFLDSNLYRYKLQELPKI